MVAYLTYHDVNELLSIKNEEEEFLTREQLERFPFGSQLKTIIYPNPEDGTENKDYRLHGKRVLINMNKLLGDNPGSLLSDLDEDTQSRLAQVKLEIGNLFSHFDPRAKALFRIAALYHDIGKYIIKERHPTVGWYTLEFLDEEQKRALLLMLDNREDYLQLLLIMVRDHDVFGDLSTGEASYPVLLRAANSLGNDLYTRNQIISAMMWLNLADVAGTTGITLNANDLNKLIYDWKWFVTAMVKCSQDNLRLDDYVIQEASSEELVIRRISRLLLESSRSIESRQKELSKARISIEQPREESLPSWIRNRKKHRMSEEAEINIHVPDRLEDLIVTQWVQSQLEKVYPTHIPRRDFCVQFTHICKLDYAKRFFSKMVKYYENPSVLEENGSDHEIKLTRLSNEDLIYSVMAILKRMASTYAPMLRIENGVGNLIGLEMKDLTPEKAEEKTIKIIQLLRSNHYPGLSWLMSDCLAWYF